MRTCGFTHRELSDTRRTQKDSYGTNTLLFLVLSVFKAGLRKIHLLLKRGLITGVFPQSELDCRCSARDGGLHEAGKKSFFPAQPASTVGCSSHTSPVVYIEDAGGADQCLT